MSSMPLNPSTWIETLPADWQQWVIENIERGCDPVGIASILNEHGFGLSEQSRRAINNAELVQIGTDSAPSQAITDKPLSSEKPCSNEIASELSHQWKKWLAQCVLGQVPQDELLRVLLENGYTEQHITDELAQLKQNPYFEVAQDTHHRLQKRQWLMQTIDHLARLDTAYCSKIDRIKTPDFSYFMKHYYSKHLPVILTQGIDHWPARQRWNPQYIVDQVGDAMVEVQQGRDKNPLFERQSANHRTSMLMKDFMAQVVNTEQSNNIYMTANNAAKNSQGLKALFADLADFGVGYTALDQMSSRSFLWIGPKGTFTPLHHDLTNNMLVQIYGRKKVTLIPALQVDHLYNDQGVYSQIANPHNPQEQQQYPQLMETTPLQCILNAGDALFIPIGWWHCVESLDVSISVSFTHFNAANGFAQQYPQA